MLPHLACVASVSVLFRSKERPRNEILGFARARNETRGKKCHFSRGLCSKTARKRLLRRLSRIEFLQFLHVQDTTESVSKSG